ncbi:MAG: hypothetical protein ACPGJV_14585, partial [Bacteriovoracaceae bacterium]
DFSVIRKLIESLSEKKRGMIRDQLDKIQGAAKKGKFGPLSFSGGVKLYFMPGLIFICNRAGERELFQIDGELEFKLRNDAQTILSKAHGVLDLKGRLFPFVSCPQSEKRNAKHPLFPKSTDFLLKKGLDWKYRSQKHS